MKKLNFTKLLLGLVIGAGIGYWAADWSPDDRKDKGPDSKKGLHLEGMDTERYKIQQAAARISDFLHDPRRKALASSDGFSGYFEADYFKAIESACGSNENCGIRMWFCQDSVNNDLFLAIEKEVAVYDSGNLPTHPPVGATLYRSRPGGGYAQQTTDDHAVTQFLRAAPNTRPLPAVRISRDEVVKGIDHFKKIWGQECAYSLSFFAETNERDIRHCVEQAGTGGYFRYFIGYAMRDLNDVALPNRFRLILVATDSNGRARLKVQSQKNPEDPILQSSWPPPPF